MVEEPGLTGDIGRLIARLAADETAALHGRAVGDEIEELRSSFLQAREAIDLASLDLQLRRLRQLLMPEALVLHLADLLEIYDSAIEDLAALADPATAGFNALLEARRARIAAALEAARARVSGDSADLI